MFSAIFAFIVANYIPVISAYVAGGVIYAVIKWVFNLLMLRPKILEINALTDIGEEEKNRRRCYAANERFSGFQYPPQVGSNKAKLFGWATFWPINLVWTLIADVIEGAWNFIYRKCGQVLQSLTNAILPK